MANPTVRPRAHATGTTRDTWSNRRIALCSLFVALSLVASYIELPIFPPAPYLKYDPSGVVCLVAGLAFGPGTGALVCVLSWLPHLLMDPFGGLMGIACSIALTAPAAAVYGRLRSRWGGALGMALGAIAALAVAVGGNVLITPLYSGMAVEQVVALIVPVLLPFNLLKIVLNCVLTRAVYKPVSILVGE